MTDLTNEPVSGLVLTATSGIAAHSCTARYGCPTCSAALAALAELQRRLERADYPEIPGPCDTHPIRDWEGDKT